MLGRRTIPEPGGNIGWTPLRSFPDFGPAKRTECELSGVSLRDFFAYMPMHNYIHAPSRETWPGASVNARLPVVTLTDASGQPLLDDKGRRKTMSPSAWLDRHQPVEQITWAPGLPMILRDKLIL